MVAPAVCAPLSCKTPAFILSGLRHERSKHAGDPADGGSSWGVPVLPKRRRGVSRIGDINGAELSFCGQWRFAIAPAARGQAFAVKT
ncbi:MAG: hypothetical protein BCS36_09400 [Desulfovibrio sp. MES5]|nr:MAG: hypothetical protein BCS36_09400 [Desulfovibrio sp. MES5]